MLFLKKKNEKSMLCFRVATKEYSAKKNLEKLSNEPIKTSVYATQSQGPGQAAK